MLGKKSRAIIRRDKRVISPSYTRGHPFVIERGEGVNIWDPEGRKYLDFTSGIAVGEPHRSLYTCGPNQGGAAYQAIGTSMAGWPPIVTRSTMGSGSSSP